MPPDDDDDDGCRRRLTEDEWNDRYDERIERESNPDREASKYENRLWDGRNQ